MELHDQGGRWLRNLERELGQIDAQLEKAIALNQEAALQPWLPQRLQDIRRETRECVLEAQMRLKDTEQAVAAIGEIVEAETPELWRKKRALEQARADERALLANCRLLSLESNRVLTRMDAFLQARLADRMFQRSATFGESIRRYLNHPFLLRDLGKGYWREYSAEQAGAAPWILPQLAAAALLGLLLGWALRLRLRRWAQRLTESSYRRRMAISYCRRIPGILGALAVGVVAMITGSGPVLLFALPLALYWLISPWLRAWLCAPLQTGETEDAPDSAAVAARENACRIGNALRPVLALALLWGAGRLLNVEVRLEEHTVTLLRQVYAVVMGVLMLRIVWLVMRLPALEAWRYWRLPLGLAVLSGPVAELLGYQRLAHLLFNGVVGSLSALALSILLGRYLFRRLDALNECRTEFDYRLKRWMGFERDAAVGATQWLKPLIVFTLGLALIAATLHAWNVPQTALDRLATGFIDGFQMGETTIAPLRLLLAIFGFVLFMMLSRWLRAQISERWLNHVRVDRGAKEAITNLSVYALIAFAVLLALNVAGVDLGNIALVAGALSVGIGFGLQNIVNNFVSGLILLFERPIRPGDWIVVGSTEGQVKKINIRYTLLETFDRSDVIVPNSELLSTQVTNWMLRDNFGRLIIPVGVAYGSDVDKVREILLGVGREHPLVMANDSRVPTPKCYFMGFGASSLDFDLRVFVRDVDYRLSVKSDLLFAIYKAFKEADIEIPFPQRDLHIRSGLHPEKAVSGD